MTSSPLKTTIRGAELLISIFGGWPSFHDAEVLRVEFDRNGPQVLASIDVFQFGPEINEEGFYVVRNRVIAELRFSGVESVTASGFNHQNVLFELVIQDAEPQQGSIAKFHVEFDDAYGLALTFRCESIEVVSVTPYNGTQPA